MIVYTDFFRGTPLILVAFIVGFGLPALNLHVLSNRSNFTYGVIALTLVYTAYVTEVYRAGIESVHPSQRMAARSLGLSYAQAMRYVVIPQAVRRVIPPLLNDFIGLQKDTALVSVIGVAEAALQAQALLADLRQLHLVHGRRGALRAAHDPARALHRPSDRGARAARARQRQRELRRGRATSRSGSATTSSCRDVDLDVGEHDVVCLIGASGSGKSTLLRCVNLLEQVDEGSIVGRRAADHERVAST